LKIRNGFVSNSSSSSFVVAFKDWIENAEDLKKVVYEEEECVTSLAGTFDTKTLSERIYFDMKNQDYLTFGEVFDEMFNYLSECSASKNIDDLREEAFKRTKKFMDEDGTKYVFKFDFDDYDGIGYTLETEDTFKHLNYFSINHH
jgi:hypothetical protein